MPLKKNYGWIFGIPKFLDKNKLAITGPFYANLTLKNHQGLTWAISRQFYKNKKVEEMRVWKIIKITLRLYLVKIASKKVVTSPRVFSSFWN